MHLRQILLENSGPLKALNLTLPFDTNGNPKPVLLVGANGSGKTNLLSLIGDALFEAAAVHYDDVLPARGIGRSWFRLVGAATTSVGAAGSFTLMKFDDEGASVFYREKAGQIDIDALREALPDDFKDQADFASDGSHKDFRIDDERSRELFRTGAYAYFPSSRSETPYWLNREAVTETEFDLAPRFAKRLRKPLFVDRALDQLKQWLIGTITDARADVGVNVREGHVDFNIISNPVHAVVNRQLYDLNNKIIQIILGDPLARFVWLGRKNPAKVSVLLGDGSILPSLDSLSAGQAILLGIFGTILRYGDLGQDGLGVAESQIDGICLVDEIDAHIHIELQNSALPRLMKLFPKIQFIVSSHSPLFVLGMEKEFGPEGIQVISLPSGDAIGAEAYSEFGRALEAVGATTAFEKRLLEEARKSEKPVVFVEGETDAPYLKRSAALLGRGHILDACDIEWIGSKDDGGQAYLTGKDALSRMEHVLKANPNLARRPILLLHDNDSTASDKDFEDFSIRKLPISTQNTIVQAGVENLLSEDSITDDFYETKESVKASGDKIVRVSLRKSDLCHHICEHGTPEQVSGFSGALDIIEQFLDSAPCVSQSSEQTSPVE